MSSKLTRDKAWERFVEGKWRKTKKQLQKLTSLKTGLDSTEMLWAEIFTSEFCTSKLAEFIFFSIQRNNLSQDFFCSKSLIDSLISRISRLIQLNDWTRSLIDTPLTKKFLYIFDFQLFLTLQNQQLPHRMELFCSTKVSFCNTKFLWKKIYEILVPL